jgi:protein TonB
VSINGDAQAGTDAFGIGAGRGGGMTGGGGIGAGSYDRYVANALQQALARDPRTKQLAFEDISIDVWLDADGKVIRTQLVRGTGSARIDEPVTAVIGELRIDERPASAGYHKRIVIKGRRP